MPILLETNNFKLAILGIVAALYSSEYMRETAHAVLLSCLRGFAITFGKLVSLPIRVLLALYDLVARKRGNDMLATQS